MIIQNVGNALTKEKAEKLAADLNADDTEGLTYKVRENFQGGDFAVVEIYDIHGFIGLV